MKRIPLTQSRYALIDDDDYERVSQLKWYALRVGNTYYAVRQENYGLVYMHRFILDVPSTEVEIDHADHDGLNNQRPNLKIATHTQNGANRKSANSNSKTGVRGVFALSNGRYQVQVKYNYVNHYGGAFDTIEEAAAAAKALRDKLHT